MTLVRRVARPMLAAMFVVGGLDQLKHPGRKADTARPARREARARPSACPTTPSCWCAPTAPRWSAPGSLLALGRLPRLASTVLAATLVPTTLAAHAFWEEQDPEARAQQQRPVLQEPRPARRPAPRRRRHRGQAGPGLARAHGQRQRPPRRPPDPPRGAAPGARGRPRGQAEGGPGAACHRLTGRPPPPPGRSTRASSCPGSKSLTNRALVLAALARRLPACVGAAALARHPADGRRPCAPLGRRRRRRRRRDWLVTPGRAARRRHGRLRARRHVMRFVPPVAALADGPVRFDGDPHARLRPMAPVLGALRALGVEVDDDGRGAPAVHRRTARGVGARRRSSPSTPRRRRSSSRRCCSPAPASTRASTCATTARPVPSLPHIEMTVEMLRDARRRGRRRATCTPGGSSRARSTPLDVQVEPDLSNAAPFLAAALVTGGRVHVPGWPQHTTQAGDALRDVLDMMGAEVVLDRAGLTVTGGGGIARHRRRPARRRRAHPGGRRAVRARRLARRTCAASPTSAATRPTGSPPCATELSGARRPTSTETDDGLRDPPARRCTAARSTPTPTTGWRTAGGSPRARACPACVVEDIATVAKTLPDFAAAVGRHAQRPGRGGRLMAAVRRARLRRVRRTSPPQPHGHPPAHQGPARPRRRRRRPGRPASTAAATPRWSATADRHVVTAMKARELGRKGVVVGDRVRLVGDISGADGTPGPDRAGRRRAAPCCAAPPTTTTRSSG